MTQHNIRIDKKYFEPIRAGKVTLLIFKKQEIFDFEENDTILSKYGSYEVEAAIKNTCIKSFKYITEEEARAAGFLNKEFLKEELIRKFELTPDFSLYNQNIDKELFFLIEIENKSQLYTELNLNKVDLYSIDYNKEFYKDWPQYTTWRTTND